MAIDLRRSTFTLKESVVRRLLRLTRLADSNRMAAWSLGWLLSAGKTLKARRVHRIRRDASGLWVHEEGGTTYYGPTPHTATTEVVEALALDHWCHVTPVGPGSTVIDVGAGNGDETVFFSRLVGPTGKVVCIEAHPTTTESLRRTVTANRLANVHIIEVAVSDEIGEISMSNSLVDHVANADVGDRGDDNHTVRVPTDLLDNVLDALDLDRVDLLKMNIEGAETKALRGMTSWLAATRAVAISCHDFLATEPDDPGRTKDDVWRLLDEAGFELTHRPEANPRFVRYYVYGVRRAHEAG